MFLEDRNKRIRLLVRKLNRERKQQARKIDILCKDLIGAQRKFIKRLHAISFSTDFYESLIGTTRLTDILSFAEIFIKERVDDVNVTLFIRGDDGFQSYTTGSDQPILDHQLCLENCFTQESFENICRTNNICNLDQMLEMNLECNLSVTNKLSAYTIPLEIQGLSLGFILIYRPIENKLTPEDLETVTSIIPGLSKAITTSQSLLKTKN
ncbi:hypothetical protein ACFL3G_12980 [Planctomycetota bacterium]